MKKSIVIIFIYVVFNSSVFACGCSSVIISTNERISENIKGYFSDVESDIDSLNSQLDKNLKEIQNRTVIANDEYFNLLKKLLTPFGIDKLKNEPIEGFLLKIKISPIGSESMKLNQFLFEYKKLIQLKFINGAENEGN